MGNVARQVQLFDAAGEDEEEWREGPGTVPLAFEQELSEAVDQLVNAVVLIAAAPEPEVPAAHAAPHWRLPVKRIFRGPRS